MDQETGLHRLASRGWLSATPADFRQSLLSKASWHRVEAGALIQHGGEEEGELIGLAQGTINLRTILGASDTPIMHIVHPVFWLGYIPLILGQPRRVSASAKSPLLLARIHESIVKKLLSERPEFWRYFLQPTIIYGDICATAAADLLIRDSQRRCAAVLLRLCGKRFPGPDDAKSVEIVLSHDELAGAANLSRNSIGMMLRRLAARGLVELRRRGITVCAPAALRQYVEQG